MTLVDADVEQPPPPPPARPGRRLRVLGIVAGVLILAVVGAGVAATTYYDGVPVPGEFRADHAVVDIDELPMPVLNTFVAAVDPSFYEDPFRPWSGSLITRRYAAYAAQDNDARRTGIMANKLEDRYSHLEILGFYLNSADFGRGAVGLEPAAQAYFGKPATRLTVAEAAVLAARLAPDASANPKAVWEQVLRTMAARGWLAQAELATLAYPNIR
ncbi:biosynthetic peptidoglycan transglycosylase [Catellatospora sichuanensis]|uniref:biosynthetic peptidoglycan transglycosylase n=1 Tax=Catellatospora sichuanensis TaxID=1969805 RepID=UPI001181DB29|nr:biosynthetic peptidoglycan transglycosylase [Catellatospora sichuanensis]